MTEVRTVGEGLSGVIKAALVDSSVHSERDEYDLISTSQEYHFQTDDGTAYFSLNCSTVDDAELQEITHEIVIFLNELDDSNLSWLGGRTVNIDVHDSCGEVYGYNGIITWAEGRTCNIYVDLNSCSRSGTSASTTLRHELIHLCQYVTGRLESNDQDLWDGVPFDGYINPAEFQAHHLACSVLGIPTAFTNNRDGQNY